MESVELVAVCRCGDMSLAFWEAFRGEGMGCVTMGDTKSSALDLDDLD